MKPVILLKTTVLASDETEDGAGGVLQAELRRVGRGSRDHISRREEVEDAAGGVGLLAERGGEVTEGVVGGVGDDVVAGGGVVVGEAEAADHVGEPENRLAEVAACERWRLCHLRVLPVGEDSRNDGLHIAAHIAAVVGEDGRDAGDIGGAGIAGHEMLDELPADEGTDIGMSKDVGERAVEILRGGLPGRESGSVEKHLRGGVVVRFDRGHGHGVVGGAIGEAGGSSPGGRGVGPAGDRRGRRPGLDPGCRRECRVSGRVELGRAIGVEEIEAHGEELHEFAGVVLVRDLGNTVHGDGLVAVEHVEIGAHAGGEGDVLHDGGEVAEGVVDEGVLEGDYGAGVDGVGGDDEHLGECEGDALAELIGRGEGGLPPLGLQRRGRGCWCMRWEAWQR